jgi:uncharacterized membrane protein YkoI
MQYKERVIMNEKAIVKIDADGDVIKCAKGLGAGECGFKAGAKVCGACGAMAVMSKASDPDVDEDMEDEEDEDMDSKEESEESEMPDEDEEDEEDEDMDDAKGGMYAMRNAKKRRMQSMGMKSEEWDDEAFICSFDRKVYPGSTSVCENCPGGCASEANLPGLLEIEGMAEDMFSGKTLDSGYSDQADLFVVDVERKDGKAIEAFFDGSTGECMGWHMLTDDVLSQKSADGSALEVISFVEAADIATKSIQGEVVAVDPDIFEGFDAYAVEIEGVDGKSYDVFVSLDGEVLGYDEYDAEAADEIEAEAAEIALKRAYTDNERETMAKAGTALPDGSYPIKDEEDLKNAIQAFGRAKDKNAAKAHIMKRALALKLEDLIPENWVPKKIQEQFAGGKKDAEDDFVASLIEFEIFTAEEEISKP